MMQCSIKMIYNCLFNVSNISFDMLSVEFRSIINFLCNGKFPWDWLIQDTQKTKGNNVEQKGKNVKQGRKRSCRICSKLQNQIMNIIFFNIVILCRGQWMSLMAFNHSFNSILPYKIQVKCPAWLLELLTNYMAYGTRRFNAAFTRALQ